MEQQYLALLREILEDGEVRSDRTGTGTRSLFGRMYRHDLAKGFPLLTTKKVHVKSVIHELLWFLSGDTNTAYLRENHVTIWDEWATETGDLGPLYGAQWRNWPSRDGGVIDQVSGVVESIRRNPDSRRHIINAWNVAFLPDETICPQANVLAGLMALAPCHVMYQFYVSKGRLSCLLSQRSCDFLLGGPFNYCSLALLTHMVAQQCDLEPGEIIHSLGDVHLYENHLEQARLQLSREPRALPTLTIKRKPASILEYKFEDFEITGYDPHPAISAPIAI